MQLESRPQRRDEILTQEIAGTVVLLSLAYGHYYALDDVGARVWGLCDGRHTVAQMATLIGQEYEAPAETIQADVLELLGDLAHDQLIVN